jgi:hypothetical protein
VNNLFLDLQNLIISDDTRQYVITQPDDTTVYFPKSDVLQKEGKHTVKSAHDKTMSAGTNKFKKSVQQMGLLSYRDRNDCCYSQVIE